MEIKLCQLELLPLIRDYRKVCNIQIDLRYSETGIKYLVQLFF